MAGSSSQARAIIELLCKILEENGVSGVIRAETLRQAKFNKQSATEPLWRLLFNTITFCCSSKTPDGKFKPLLTRVLKEEELIFVKCQLQRWGFLNHSFARVPHDFSTGSRELLLALGWVIHTQSLFDKIILARPSPLQQDLMRFVHPQGPLPSLGICTYVRPENNNQTRRETIQRQLMLSGKLRLSLRRLYMAHQELAGLKLTICKSTEGVNLQACDSHLSPLEVYLLRFPESLKKMLDELEKDNEQMKNLLDYKDKEHIFWEWMSSVLTLHNQQKTCTVSESSSTTGDVYLALPPAIEQEIVASRTKLRDFILHHEADIELMEQLIMRKKVSDVEVMALKYHVDKEISQLSQRLQNCGQGWMWDSQEDMLQRSSDSPAQQTCQTETSVYPQTWPKPKYMIQTTQAVKTANQAKILEGAKAEIFKLERKVQQLESELKQTEKENMRKLHSLIEKDVNVICVQPRYCKQLIV